MPLIGGTFGYQLLKRIAPMGKGKVAMDGSAYKEGDKLAILLGRDTLEELRGKTIVDFGCGEGQECIELLRHGAAHVIGVDIQSRFLQKAAEVAESCGVSDRCTFATSWGGKADAIVSIDSFEHFDDPEGVLRAMHGMLRPDGRLFVSFGPSWYHPLGGHLFSVFPWAHLVFSEASLIRWRTDFKDDGATRFSEVAGGLNQMTITRFEQIVARSDFVLERLRAVPIRRLAPIHNSMTREFTTAIVQATLRIR